jgi:anti-sigma factor RsiW
MNRHQCCHDKALLVGYLYNECSDAERKAVEAHLAECADCAADLAGLRAVRGSLSHWQTPERVLGIRVVSPGDEGLSAVVSEESTPVAPRRRWTPPWWLQTAAAVLLVAAAAGVAQIEVRYGSDGLVVRTGWSKAAAPATVTQSIGAPAQAPWRQDLAAFEQELRRELLSTARLTAAAATRASQTSRAGVSDRGAGAPGLNEDALMRRVRALIEQSERKQQRELAMRLADVVRDVDIQRRADQIRVQQTFGQLEGQTGVAVRQNRDLLNYLVRVSQQR